jgi:mycothiol synthase
MAVALSSPAVLDEQTAAAVRQLAADIEHRDGQPPLSDHALTRLTSANARHVVAVLDGQVIGYGHLEDGNAEIALGELSASSILDILEPEIAEIWSHGTRSMLRPLLDERGFRARRVLHQLRRPASEPVEAVEPPSGVTVDTFRVGEDDEAWLAVNAAAFAEHPEQGCVTLADLQALEAESWFNAADFFLAHRDGEVLGYHWTKVHADGSGEVYVLGISPAAQGLGLGKVLLAIGLRHLAEIGCPTVLLYVDESNTGAMRLYESARFTRYDADTQWVPTT